MALSLSSREWLQTYHDTIGSFKSWQGNVLHCSQLCVPKHTCSHMQINVAHQNTFWKETVLDWDWPCCWVLITAAIRQQQPVHSMCQCSQEQPVLLIPTDPVQYIPLCEMQEPSRAPRWVAALRSGCEPDSGLDWQKELLRSWQSRGCCRGIAVMVCLPPLNTPAVSCSSLELKHALFTLTTALNGEIKVDFEVVEFTHQFCFLQL